MVGWPKYKMGKSLPYITKPKTFRFTFDTNMIEGPNARVLNTLPTKCSF